MPDIIIYDVLNKRVKDHRESVDPTPYVGKPDVIIYDENSKTQTIQQIRDLIDNNPLEYLKVESGIVVPMSQNEKFSIDSEIDFLERKERAEIEKMTFRDSYAFLALAELLFPNLSSDEALSEVNKKIDEISKRR